MYVYNRTKNCCVQCQVSFSFGSGPFLAGIGSAHGLNDIWSKQFALVHPYRASLASLPC